ncbi:hypothetical protein NMK34_14085 [Micromonospora sp. BRA006-A]|uniref:hypothetical protein n=1 Tax=Micromonospora sp. BRA006-A TaxID=2962860 RepID=UPI00296FA02B|nr:hypothetical protein [Micromonospora sp. BRA006-A]MDW3847730.1 hypothetical protein [Micromonospora sp. BRA006-A]
MHRRLLLAYPRDYRRARGAEILETVRDVGSAHRRTRVAANLVRHGLRTRLGRPASRTVVVWAAVFAVVCGLFAASFGTWLAWLGSRPLDHRDLAAVVGQLYPDRQVSHIDRDDPPAVFLIYGHPLTEDLLSELLLGDGGEYALAELTASFDQTPAGGLTNLRQRLDAAGWKRSEPVRSDAYGCVPGSPRCDPASIPSDITVYAERGDHILAVELNAEGSMNLTLGRATPGAAYPAGVIGFALGTLGGWVLFGWASRRTEGRRPLVQGPVKVLYGVAMLFWTAPVLLGAPMMLTHHLGEPHPRWHVPWEWLGQPALSLPFLLGAVLLIVALGLAALPHRRAAGRTLAGASDPAL